MLLEVLKTPALTQVEHLFHGGVEDSKDRHEVETREIALAIAMPEGKKNGTPNGVPANARELKPHQVQSMQVVQSSQPTGSIALGDAQHQPSLMMQMIDFLTC